MCLRLRRRRGRGGARDGGGAEAGRPRAARRDSGYGTLDERLAQGHEIEDEERALMDRALAENAVIVAQVTPFFDKG